MVSSAGVVHGSILCDPIQPNPTHQKLKNLDPTQPMGQPGPRTTLVSAYRRYCRQLGVRRTACWCTRAPAGVRAHLLVYARTMQLRSRETKVEKRKTERLPACRTPRRVLKPTHQGAAPVRRPQDRESAARNAAQVGRLPTTQRRTGTMMTLAEQSRWERMPLDPAAYIGRMCRPPAKSSGKMLAEKLINSHSRAVSKHKLHTAYEFSEIFQSCLGSLAYLFARPVLKLFQQPFRHQQVE